MKKPAYIDKVQRIHARVMPVAKFDAAATAGPDGTFPVDHFGPGLQAMAEEDWRQFRMTPDNAVHMVDGVNAAIAAGKKLRGNYVHDRSGPIAAEIVRAEVTAGGGVRSFVKWSERAQTSIRPDANGVREYEGTSPEFRARVVLDQDGTPVEENGRVLMEPFELEGFALDNDPAMPDLAIAANAESQQPGSGKEEPIMETKKLAAMLGLPETASVADMEKAMEAMKKTMQDMETAMKGMKGTAGAEPPSVETLAAAVLAKIETAKNEAIGAIDEKQRKIAAVEHEKAVVQTVDAAIRGGRVKKSERDAALKVAKADLESFKTMTASMKVVAPVAPMYVPGEGTKPAAAGDGVPLARHRFDVIGPETCAASEDPHIRAYAEKITWIANHEKVNGREFPTAAAAFAAYDSARVRQAG